MIIIALVCIFSVVFVLLIKSGNYKFFVEAKQHRNYRRKTNLITFTCKYVLSWIYFWTQKLLSKRTSLKLSLESYAQSIFTTKQEWAAENPQVDEDYPDHFQFSGFDPNGDFLFIDLVYNQSLELVIVLDGRQYNLLEPKRQLHKRGSTWISAGGLRLEVKEPFRRWKINFRGYLESNLDQEKLFVKFSAYWSTISEVYDFWDDTNLSCFANAAAQATDWIICLEFLKRLQESQHYHQFGQIFGKYFIDGHTETEKELLLRGHKIREHGKFFRNKEFDWMKHSNIYLEDGTCVHLTHADICSYESTFNYGWIVLPKGEIIQIGALKEKHGVISFLTDKNQNYTLSFMQSKQIGSLNIETYSWNTHTGTGITLETYKKPWTQKQLCGKWHDSGNTEILDSYPTIFPVEVLPLSHVECKKSSTSGGKAKNLSKLMDLQINFTVPKGVCVTTAAYAKHLNNVEAQQWRLESAENHDIWKIAQKLSESIMGGSISESLRSGIISEMSRQFSDAWESSKLFAVRSSAVGEDSHDFSSAGQLETFLYISRIDNICDAIKKCWTSNFRKEVVEYRKQHGQCLTAPMAVVIQEMIDPDIAGVLFTQDPASGDPEKLIINASLGVGESVVSGDVNPDTVVIQRSHALGNTILRKQAGNAAEPNTICISDEISLRLGDIGAYLEQCFNNVAQDIEWAVKDSRIYILQSRDITSFEVETEWDLLHEFDTGSTADTDWHTTANVGEVLPEGMTPMAISLPILDAMIQFWFERSNKKRYISKYFKAGFMIYRNRIFMNILKGFFQDSARIEDTTIQEISFMGHVLEEKRVKEEASYRYPFPGYWISANKLWFVLKACFGAERCRKHAATVYANFKLPSFSSSPMEMLNMIQANSKHWADAWMDHMSTTMQSSLSYSIVAAFRSIGQEWTPELIADVATLYADCQSVVSADIPEALKKIAMAIIEFGDETNFMRMETSDALKWLSSEKSGTAGEFYTLFMQKHGHRCSAEIDVGSLAWWQKPDQLISSIKSLLNHKEGLRRTKPVKSVDDTIKSLKSPMGRHSRMMLAWAIPKARNSVAAREATKGFAVQVTDQFKRAFLRIGNKLHHQGYLPDPQLIFFLTFHEVEELINCGSGALVGRAVRRKKIMALQNACVYPEMMHGHPKPLEKERSLIISKVVKGTGVCQGYVEGIARVAHSLSDAIQTKPGEILITRSTDISWSPYFPVISGLVTELGGLLSHGAVVAREYGLPCLVGAANALDSFKTGDHVVLDTTKGCIEKIEN